MRRVTWILALLASLVILGCDSGGDDQSGPSTPSMSGSWELAVATAPANMDLVEDKGHLTGKFKYGSYTVDMTGTISASNDFTLVGDNPDGSGGKTTISAEANYERNYFSGTVVKTDAAGNVASTHDISGKKR